MEIKIKKINSNITLLSNHFESKTLSMGVWLNVGSVNEGKNEVGIAHMLEHMAFKGTKNRNAVQIATEIEDVGGDINAYTSKENTAYFLRVLPENLALGLDILADIVLNSIFPEIEIEKERGVILSEIGQYNDTPDDRVFENFNKTAFKNQSLGMSILGTKESVSSFQKHDLMNFFDKNYNVSNLIIGVCGKFEENILDEIVADKFNNLKKGEKISKPSYIWNDGKILEEKDIEQSHIVFGYEGVSYTDKDRFALRALSIILGGGMSSKLFQKIREEKGYCYNIFSFCSHYENSGVFGVYSACLPKNLFNLVDTLTNEFHNLVNNIKPEEVEKAKSQMKASFLMGQDSSMSRLELNVRSMFNFKKIVTEAEVLNEINKLEIKNIRNSYYKMLTRSKPVLSVYGKGISSLESFSLI